MSDSTLSSTALICVTHTHIHKGYAHTHTLTAQGGVLCSDCLPRPPLFPAHSGKDDMCFMAKNHCTVYLLRLCLRQTHHGSRLPGRTGGRLTEWHIHAARRLQKDGDRKRVSEKSKEREREKLTCCLVCCLVRHSQLAPQTNEQDVCLPEKPERPIKSSWGADDEKQNDADLKMSAGVAFLIVHSHCSTHWCA